MLGKETILNKLLHDSGLTVSRNSLNFASQKVTLVNCSIKKYDFIYLSQKPLWWKFYKHHTKMTNVLSGYVLVMYLAM